MLWLRRHGNRRRRLTNSVTDRVCHAAGYADTEVEAILPAANAIKVKPLPATWQWL